MIIDTEFYVIEGKFCEMRIKIYTLECTLSHMFWQLTNIRDGFLSVSKQVQAN